MNLPDGNLPLGQNDSRKAAAGLAAALVYIGLMGIGMWYMRSVRGVTYGDLAMFDTFWVVLLAVNATNFFFLFRYFGWRGAGFGRLDWRQFVWFAPFVVYLAYKWWIHLASFAVSPPSAEQWRLFAFLGTMTFLVGLGEELAFRGLLLRGFFDRRAPLRGLLVSAVGFSLLHSVNYFGGEPLSDMLFQLGYTFLWGFYYAPVAIRLNSIWPLVLAHWLFDFAQFTVLITQKVDSLKFDSAFYPVEIALGAVLWYQLWRDRDR